jgi:hypothetical protein
MATVCNPYWREAAWSIYRYVPSIAPAVIFCLLFLVSGILHLWQMWRTKAWFLTALVLGCLCKCLVPGFLFPQEADQTACAVEFIGYAARASSANEEPGCWKLMPYIIQSIFILLGPALFSVSVYMILGRIVELVGGDKHVMVKQHLITRVFVTGDVVCLLLQSAGKVPLESLTLVKTA